MIVNKLKKYGLTLLLSALVFVTGCKTPTSTVEQSKESAAQTEQQSEETTSVDVSQQDALTETDTSETSAQKQAVSR